MKRKTTVLKINVSVLCVLASCQPSENLTGSEQSSSVLPDLAACQTVGSLSAGTVYDDWSPSGWSSYGCFTARPWAHWGNVITGLDTDGISIGDRRIIWNEQPQGYDAPLVFANWDSRSDAENRFWLPEENDVIIGPLAWAEFAYVHDAFNDRDVWSMVSTSSPRQSQVIAQQLMVSAPITIAAISGTVNNWAPTGTPVVSGPWCQAGNQCDGSRTTAWNAQVDAGGATVTGIEYAGINYAAGQGPVKFLCNFGPGKMTLKHQSASSSEGNRLMLPSSHDYVLPACGAEEHATAGCCTILYRNTLVSSWLMLGGPSANDGKFPTVSGDKFNTGYGNPPAAFSAGNNNDMDLGCGTESRIRLSPVGSSVLTGIVAGTPGDVCVLQNFSTTYVISDYDSASATANRIRTPGGAGITSPVWDSVTCVYDQNGFWLCE